MRRTCSWRRRSARADRAFFAAKDRRYVEKLNENIRSDIELGRSVGGDYAREEEKMIAAPTVPVAAEN